MLLHKHTHIPRQGDPVPPGLPGTVWWWGPMENIEALAWPGLLELGTLSRSPAPIGSGIRRGIGDQGSIIHPSWARNSRKA